MRPSQDYLLKLAQVSHNYGSRVVLHQVDLCIKAGEVVALLGANGAGKTTLLKIVAGVIAPDSGEINGPCVDRSSVGWVPQGNATWGRLTVRENLEQFILLRGLGSRRSTPKLAASEAHLAQLDPWLDTLASELSGGLRQRLSLAIGLLGNPTLLVLDEPTTGLDISYQTTLFELIHARAKQGVGTLLSTHSVEDAIQADRCIVLHEGQVLFNDALPLLTGERTASTDPSDVRAALLALWQGASS